VLGTLADAIGTIIADPRSDASQRAKKHVTGILGSTLVYYTLDDLKNGRKDTYAELCERIQPHLEGVPTHIEPDGATSNVLLRLALCTACQSRSFQLSVGCCLLSRSTSMAALAG